ncbi:MAG: hypothetical protein WDK96_01715 [Candidatus Paceibacterota bacterium]|jgi:hypothetical protein
MNDIQFTCFKKVGKPIEIPELDGFVTEDFWKSKEDGGFIIGSIFSFPHLSIPKVVNNSPLVVVSGYDTDILAREGHVIDEAKESRIYTTLNMAQIANIFERHVIKGKRLLAVKEPVYNSFLTLDENKVLCAFLLFRLSDGWRAQYLPVKTDAPMKGQRIFLLNT